MKIVGNGRGGYSKESNQSGLGFESLLFKFYNGYKNIWVLVYWLREKIRVSVVVSSNA